MTEEQVTEEQLEKWKTDFKELADIDGYITKGDIEVYLQKADKNPSESDIDSLVAGLDTDGKYGDGDGKIGLDEFIKIQQDAAKMTFFTSDIRLELEKALEAFDENNDGTISKEELKSILVGYDDETLADVIRNTDTNNDGQLSIKELALHLTKIVR